MINDYQSQPSIIKDYTKLTDAQLKANILKGYEEAILEQARRDKRITIYQMPDGDWAATAEGIITDGFKTKELAREWVKDKLRETGWQLQRTLYAGYAHKHEPRGLPY